MNIQFRQPLAWMLIATMVAAFVAFFFSLQLGFFLLLFAATGWWVWHHPEEGFLLLILLAPLLSMFKATQTIGTFTLIKDVIIAILLIRTFLFPLITKHLPYRRSLVFAPALAITLWTIFEIMRADALTLGILRAREILLYLSLYFAVLYLPHTRQAWRERLLWFTASVIMTLILGLFQWFFANDSAVLRFDPGRSLWIPRISSTFGHPSVFGEYLVAAAALFGAGALSFTQLRQRTLFGLLTAMSIPFIFLTYSRAVWIGFVCALVAMSWIYLAKGLREHSFRGKKWQLAGGGIIAIALIIFGLLRFTPADSLLRSIFDPTYKSNQARVEFAVRLLAPMTNLDALIGRGLGDVVQQKLLETDIGVEEITQGASRQIQLAKDQTLVDNQYLKTFIEMGLVGLLLYFWLFWRLAKGAWEGMKEERITNYELGIRRLVSLWSIGFLAAFIVQAAFIDIWDVFPTNMMFWIAAALLSASLMTPQAQAQSVINEV